MGTYTATAGENLSQRSLCYIGSDGKLYKCSRVGMTNDTRCVAMAAEAISADANGNFYTRGEVSWTSGITPGSTLYVGLDGAISSTPPTESGEFLQIVGHVESANTVFFDPCPLIIEVA